MVIVNFFMVNLLVGVIVSSYNRSKDKSGKNFLMTSS